MLSEKSQKRSKFETFRVVVFQLVVKEDGISYKEFAVLPK